MRGNSCLFPQSRLQHLRLPPDFSVLPSSRQPKSRRSKSPKYLGRQLKRTAVKATQTSRPTAPKNRRQNRPSVSANGSNSRRSKSLKQQKNPARRTQHQICPEEKKLIYKICFYAPSAQEIKETGKLKKSDGKLQQTRPAEIPSSETPPREPARLKSPHQELRLANPPG